MAPILVTGGTGYIGTFSIVDLLEKGYDVRTTVRNLGRVDELKKSILKLTPKLTSAQLEDKVSFYKADLTSDEGWNEAITGVEYILHVASPFPNYEPKDPNELIVPAREGALRVLRHAKKLGVKRVVLTSSYAAIGYGHPNGSKISEKDWTNVEKMGSAYVKSKTLAEKAAWDFINAQDHDSHALELVVINPTGVFGPIVPGSTTSSTSTEIITKLLAGEMKYGAPKISFGLIDVRDVARIHVEAIKSEKAKGERFILVAPPKEVTLLQMATILRQGLKSNDPRINDLPTWELPTWLLRILSYVVPDIKAIIGFIGVSNYYTSEKAQKVFNWTPIPPEKIILDTVASLDAESKK
ncbi:putative NADPH-dependent methylglyoxal reductase Grp2p [[Candida] anglica]|uniref:NADPH-dependent methylglyoxal reductase Grp2p n=1 Tax=[Candida] anglica TaxID=148631 RepID=A0ABP0EBI5_9ASCO